MLKIINLVNGEYVLNKIGSRIANLNRLTSKKIVGIENTNINEIFNYSYDNRD